MEFLGKGKLDHYSLLYGQVIYFDYKLFAKSFGLEMNGNDKVRYSLLPEKYFIVLSTAFDSYLLKSSEVLSWMLDLHQGSYRLDQTYQTDIFLKFTSVVLHNHILLILKLPIPFS